MPSKQVYLKGKAKWVHTNRPDPKYGKYSMVLYPDEESLGVIKKMKADKPAILNELKLDDDGYNMKFACSPNQNINGKIQVFTVDVLKADGMPLTEALVGNGSDVTVKLDWYTYRKGEGAAVRLKAIRVDNLIPFIPSVEFDEGMKENVDDLGKQPKPNF